MNQHMDIEITKNYDSSKVRDYEPRANINSSQEGGRPVGQKVIITWAEGDNIPCPVKAESFRNWEEQQGSCNEEQGNHQSLLGQWFEGSGKESSHPGQASSASSVLGWAPCFLQSGAPQLFVIVSNP